VPLEVVCAVAELANDIDGVLDGIEVKTSVVRHSPSRQLLDAGATASMIVVGRRGLGAISGSALGSVSRQVVHHAPCPVVVVPPPSE
jgi:nucleotide-binding universal stress UspA family protein